MMKQALGQAQTNAAADRERTLLVVDVRAWEGRRLARAIRSVVSQAGAQRTELHVMPFVEENRAELTGFVQSIAGGPVTVVDTSGYLHRIESPLRDAACGFAADVRERLESVAAAAAGSAWARHLGQMWWYTEFSEKNTEGGTRPWWELARLEAIRSRLEEVKYTRCVYVGDVDVAKVLRELCAQMQIEAVTRGVTTARVALGRVLLLRVVALFSLASIVLLARLTPARLDPITAASSPNPAEHPRRAFLFSYYPRSWVESPGGHVDRYHRRLGQELEAKGVSPVHVLALFDHLNTVTLGMAWRRFWLLRRNPAAVPRYVLLEAHASLGETLRLSLAPGDLWRYWRMSRRRDFAAAFRWRGLDATSLVSPRILRSIAIDWPHMQVLKQSVQRLSEAHEPEISWLHFFEYTTGRALIAGLREAGKGRVVAVQHGPITPIRFSYAGDPRERLSSPLGAPGLPQPHLYAVEGELAREILEGSGVPRDRIVVVGAPRLDAIWKPARSSSEADRFAARQTRVLVALGLHDIRFVWPQVQTALGDDPSLRILLKHHPKTPARDVPHPTRLHAANMRTEEKSDIYALMQDADIVLGSSSSTVFEAMAFGLPVVMLTPHRAFNLNRFWSDGDVLEAGSGAELREHVRRLVEDSTFRERYVQGLQELVARAFGPADGRASERLVEAGLEAARTG